ncbi:TPA: sorbitol-6-phosphate 2-dehydrogenase, partial [Escherichia coli]|nr:sorbitol-6-phosphate 2-dehydrogenase [Escherichia coli]HAY3899604.1 sorbitol-6-phosphate 2-dehydrogenase [Escherichia coli]
MQTWLNLQDKIIIVTGGASGIGLAIVEELL